MRRRTIQLCAEEVQLELGFRQQVGLVFPDLGQRRLEVLNEEHFQWGKNALRKTQDNQIFGINIK
jgi:hypothetical protein